MVHFLKDNLNEYDGFCISAPHIRGFSPKDESGHRSNTVPTNIVRYTLYTSFMYALTNCKSTAFLGIARINGGARTTANLNQN